MRDFTSMHLKKRKFNLRRILFLNMLFYFIVKLAKDDTVADTPYIRRTFEWESTDEFNTWNAKV